MRCQLSDWRWLIGDGRLLLALALASTAQAQAVSTGDSTLVARILLAEDRRDANSAALAEGVANADPRVRTIARRAQARIGDPRFALRDSLPVPPGPPRYPD